MHEPTTRRALTGAIVKLLAAAKAGKAVAQLLEGGVNHAQA